MPLKCPRPDALTIRGPDNRRELEALADLYGKAFGRYQPLYDSFLDKHLHRMPREQWRLARAMWAPDGSPVAMVRVCHRTMRLGAAMVRVAGIGDVCTHPKLRKRGLMRTLFAHVNQFMRHEGYDLSLLFGIPNFYHKFGYVVGVATEWLLVPRGQLEELKAPYSGRRARLADAEAIRRLHLADLATRDGAMARWGDAWARRACREKWCRIISDQRGRPLAYWRGGPHGDDTFALAEASLGRRPRRDLVVSVLADLARAAKACEKPRLRIELPAAHPIGRFCVADGCEVRHTIGHRGGSMVRITHLGSLCQHMAPEWERLLAASPAAGWSGRLRLKTDIGAVDLAIGKERVRPEPPRGRAAAVIAAGQDKLCRLVLGFHAPAAAAFLGEVRISRAARPVAEAVFPVRSLAFFPYDRF